MKKQDKQGARTAQDLERKYNLGGSEQAAQKYAASAAQSAAAAQAYAERLNEGLSQSEVVASLNGESSAFTIEDGVPYLNSAYIKGADYGEATLAQVAYTAMVMGTLLSKPTRATITVWYNAGYWSESNVEQAVYYSVLTQDEANKIIGEG